MGQIQFTISLIMIGLFTVAIIGFAIEFANDNEVFVDISSDAEVSSLYTGSKSELSGFSNGSETSYASIINSTIASGDETTVSGGQFKITPVTAMAITTGILRTGYVKIFGTGSGFGIFITSFLAILLFIMGLLIWKTWAGRIPD